MNGMEKFCFQNNDVLGVPKSRLGIAFVVIITIAIIFILILIFILIPVDIRPQEEGTLKS